MRRARPLREMQRGKRGSLECLCFALTTCLPTYNLANLVCIFKTADAPMYSPLSKKPNLTLFLGPYVLILMAERARSALSLGGASVIS